jgi:hypothetical protein
MHVCRVAVHGVLQCGTVDCTVGVPASAGPSQLLRLYAPALRGTAL